MPNFARMVIDLHTHTAPKSYDALQSPMELILEAKALGLDAVCLTEHDAFWDDRDIQELRRHHKLIILPGCEINTDKGHFLAFGLREYLFGMHKFTFLHDQVNKAGGVLVAAHPYRRRQITDSTATRITPELALVSKEETFGYMDAIEGLNGRGSEAENNFSQMLSRILNIKTTGGSDSHRPGDLGTFATEFDSSITSISGLVREIKSGRFRPITLDHGSP